MSSHDGERDQPLQAYRGSVERPRPLLEISVPSAWRATVMVTELLLPGHGKTFEVRVTRYGGPKLEGTPDPVGVTIAQVDDLVAERAGEAAREIAMRAADELRAGRIPDLKELQIDVAGGPRQSGVL